MSKAGGARTAAAQMVGGKGMSKSQKVGSVGQKGIGEIQRTKIETPRWKTRVWGFQ